MQAVPMMTPHPPAAVGSPVLMMKVEAEGSLSPRHSLRLKQQSVRCPICSFNVSRHG